VTSDRDHHAFAFGLDWRADIALEAFDTDDATGCDDPLKTISVRRVPIFAERTPLRRVNRGHVYSDGFRLPWQDEVGFDMFEGNRIDYAPGPGWRGVLPTAFYSSVAALTLAWRGATPIHACAVEIEGKAIAIVGPSGVGKSSLAAGLIALGARLVADDLTILQVEGGAVVALRGRPAMRQHPDLAAAMDADPPVPCDGDPRGKWLVRPHARATETALPLGGMLMLPASGNIDTRTQALAFLAGQLFRPRWLAALPGHAARRRLLLTMAATVPLAGFPAIGTFDPADQMRRAERARAEIQAMTGV
jgi:hypothetical protein